MAKDSKSLEQSRDIRAKVLAKYGFIPISIIEPDYSWGKHIIEYDERKQQTKAVEKHSKMRYNIKTFETQSGEIKEFNQSLDAFSMSSQNVRGKQSGVSTFPPDLGRFIVEFYSEKDDTILDPTCGHNSRMQLTFELGRNYIGYDVSIPFMEFNEKVKRELLGQGKQDILFQSQNMITLRLQSSEHLAESDASIDFVYTSPPYYCVEWYGDEPEQLGKSKTYKDFLLRMKQILSECHRVLKAGKFCVFNVNDFRMDNKFYPYHADIAYLMRSVGFDLHDIVVVKWKSCIGQAFASQIEERKICAKSHEYLIVSKKPK
jgi:DNA modification methylase